ncbi:TetR/AcrR family transcriptional regulator [Rhizobium sp. 'Codium 1']|uniref:TetR/AcrR family transcriptional regulator n=1 Tax=Rhizobium sp. 'Codium 1' TaxID=2940484 RepID=UPI001E638257|nr:TetR/AcrR family transcriptional regulator [Rhizobium sp. 'Codium 1']MCC8933429.1 TetR/AcrR family transcriptional regulator [Rhizobium sp. 'Codium 1']
MKLRQSRSRQTRDQILGAARELFSRQGYEPTSIDQVASAAKVAKSSVFAHFGDKANLLAALGLGEIEKLAEAGKAEVARADDRPLADQLRALLQPWLSYFCREHAFAGLYLSQSALTRGPHTEAFLDLCWVLEDQVAELFRKSHKGSLSAERAQLLARGVQALFHEVIVFEISGWIVPPESAEIMLGRFLDIWIAGAQQTSIPPDPIA